jgi:hypothetical protein
MKWDRNVYCLANMFEFERNQFWSVWRTLFWRYRGKPRNTPVERASQWTEFRNGYFPNTRVEGLKHARCNNGWDRSCLWNGNYVTMTKIDCWHVGNMFRGADESHANTRVNRELTLVLDMYVKGKCFSALRDMWFFKHVNNFFFCVYLLHSK